MSSRGAIMERLVVAAVGFVAATAFAACGSDSSDEDVKLGAEQPAADAQQRKIDELERRIDRKRVEQARAGRGGSDRSTAGGGGDLITPQGKTEFDKLASGLGGQVGVVVGRVGAPGGQQLGGLTGGKAWSTIKLAIAAKVLSDARGPGGLKGDQAGQMRQAITASDNAAAANLFDGLKSKHGGLAGASEAVGAPLRAAGDSATSISTQGRGGFSTYGQTDWALADQQRFMSKLAAGCVPDKQSAEYLLGLMGEVVSGQRWGLGSAGVPARLKGGWGPGEGGGYLVRQTGVLELDGGSHPVVVSMAALPSDGQFATGQTMLTQMAKWVAGNVQRAKAAPAGC